MAKTNAKRQKEYRERKKNDLSNLYLRAILNSLESLRVDLHNSGIAKKHQQCPSTWDLSKES